MDEPERVQRPTLPFGVGDFHVAVHSDAQLATQNVELLWLQRTEMISDAIETISGFIR